MWEINVHSSAPFLSLYSPTLSKPHHDPFNYHVDQAAAVVAGEGRRRAARAMQMKLRCISRHKSNGSGDYLCWFSPEGRVDYFGETKGGKAHGWGLAEYQDGSWCLR